MQRTKSADTVASIDDIVTKIPTPNPAHGIFMRFKGNNSKYYYDYIPLNKSSSEPPPFDRSFSAKPHFTRVSHSCNGLLLCEIVDDTIDPWVEEPDRSIYVYNPTTDKSTKLPDLAIGTQYGPTLAFDPDKSPFYKVVMVVRVDTTDGDRKWQVHVYSSQTRVWSFGAELGTEERRGVDFRKCVFWNGCVHWLTDNLNVKDTGMSLRFNVKTGVLEDMVSPPIVQNQSYKYNSNYYFGESCDHLHFVELVLPVFNVYEMKRDYSEWFVKYKVNLSAFIGDYPEVIKKGFYDHAHLSYYVVYVLSLVRGENEEDSGLVLRIPGKAVKVNLVDGTFEELRSGLPNENIRGSFTTNAGVKSGMYYFEGEHGLDYIPSLSGV